MSSLSGAQFEADSPMSEPAAASADADLLRKARAGDRFAYGQIVRLYQDRLYNAILRLVGDRDEATELTQETFTRGLEKIETFRGESGAYTWLFRIGMNLAISQLRRSKRRRTFSLDGPADTAGRADDQAASLMSRMQQHRDTAPPAALESRERAEQVLAALGRLDAEYRAVLVMRDIEGFDYQQMAELLSLPLGTLKSRLFRARVALRDELTAFMR
jgi:RNA polymerase sigma-70 factor (ECF subfamily)